MTIDRGALSQALGTSTPVITTPSPHYYIRWQRGQLGFSLQSAGGQNQADAQALAQAIDSAEQNRPPLSLGSPTVQSPTTEAQRLEAAIALNQLLAGVQSPDGYRATSPRLDHPVSDVAGDRDPASALQREDTRWKVVSGVRADFAGTADTIEFSAVLHTNADAAQADLADEVVGPGWTVMPLQPPAPLGDVTAAYLDSGPGFDGKPQNNLSVDWVHGPLLLEVSKFGPVGSSSIDQVAALAQQFDAEFQNSNAPTSVPAVLSNGWNLVAGTGQMLIGDQFGPSSYTFGSNDATYETLASGATLKAGAGYWVYANGDEPLPLREGSSARVEVQAPAGQPVLIGDPSGRQPATVSGADSVTTHDPTTGYQQTTTLQPGQGAWAASSAGGTITITPRGATTTHATAGFNPVSSPKGLSFAIPADWPDRSSTPEP